MKKALLFLFIVIIVLLAYLALKPKIIAPMNDTSEGVTTGATQVKTNPNGTDYQPHPTGQTQTVQNAGGPDYQPGKEMEVTILVPENEAAYETAILNAENSDPAKTWKFIPKKVSVAYDADVVKASAQAAAQELKGNGEDIAYFKVVGSTAYVVLTMDIDGWAGVSYTIARVHPLVEKTLLQFPQIKTVQFKYAPGDEKPV